MRPTLQSVFIIPAVLLLCITGQANGGLVYGVKSWSLITASDPPTHLYRFQDDGSAFTVLGQVKLGGGDIVADGLALSQAGELFGFYIGSGGSTLITINPNTAAALTAGAPLPGRDIRGAAFDAAGVLWVIDAASSELLRINPTTGAVVGPGLVLTLGGNPFQVSTTTDLAQRSDGVFYLVDRSSIYTLDRSTAALSLAFTDADQSLSGAAFSSGAPPDALFAFEENNSDDIHRYLVDSGFARTTPYPNIIPAFNAGRGDLAASPPAVVPEPASLLSATLGLVALAGYAGWRRARLRRAT